MKIKGALLFLLSVGIYHQVWAGPGGGLVTPTISGSGGNSSTLSTGQSNQVVNIINTVAPTNSGITSTMASNIVNANSILNAEGKGTNTTLVTSTNINPLIHGSINTDGDLHIVTGGNQLQLDSNIALGVELPGPTIGSGPNDVLILNGDGVMGKVTEGTGVFTNSTATQSAGYTTTPSISLAGATAGTLNKAAADSSWMPITNAVAWTNAGGTLPTAGQALVVVGTNSYGAMLVKQTNWPSGGSGSQTPWAQNIDGAGFTLTGVSLLQVINSGNSGFTTIESNKVYAMNFLIKTNAQLDRIVNFERGFSAAVITTNITFSDIFGYVPGYQNSTIVRLFASGGDCTIGLPTGWHTNYGFNPVITNGWQKDIMFTVTDSRTNAFEISTP